MATSATLLLKRYSFPKVPGDQPWSIIDATGPAAYTALVPGTPGPPATPPSGAQRLTADDFGLQALDFVIALGTGNGLYSGVIVPLGGNLTTPVAFAGDDFVAFLLVWKLVATGAQATGNLSASKMRLLGIGR